MFGSCTFAFAAGSADALYELGLFLGTGKNADGSPDFSLNREPTRAEAITMLVRLLGKEEEALAGDWDMPFSDVDGNEKELRHNRVGVVTTSPQSVEISMCCGFYFA